MLLAQISDTHIMVAGAEHPATEARAENLARCVVDINAQKPDLVVFTGDTVQHGQTEEYARLRALLAPLEAPLYVIPGNRDDNEALRVAFEDKVYLPTEGRFLHYAIEHHELRLVALDSTDPGERKGVFCQERQAWLDVILGAAPDRQTVLLIHHPPFDIGDHYIGGYRRPEEAEALADIVSRYPQVARLICGHVHCPTERPWAGTIATTMPSVAVDVRKGIDESEAREQPIYLLHRFSDAGEPVSQARTAAC